MIVASMDVYGRGHALVTHALYRQEKKHGLSVCQTYAGAAIHADDLRTTVASKDAVSQQASVRAIGNFAKYLPKMST